jgi:glycerol-3-phosphate dehydrogenase
VTPAEQRAAVLEELGKRTFDVLVVGAGIVGCRIALDAASSGMSVALIDRGDLACGTSSASSKFIHGGFRYLGMGDIRLVRAAQLERAALMRRVPELVKPMPIVVALDRRRYPRPLVQLGVAAYRRLDGPCEARARILGSAEAAGLVPGFSCRSSHLLALLPEAQTDDARLTIATARAAANGGALVANYVGVEALEIAGGRVAGAFARDRVGASDLRIRCRSIVNATGAHIDVVRRLENPTCQPLAVLSKGIHLVLPLEKPWRAGIASYSDDHRTTFVVPWQGVLLVGTTDSPFSGSPAAVGVDADEEAAVLTAARRLVNDGSLRSERIRFRFAGLRVLSSGAPDTARVSREHILAVGAGGMVSVAGGKLTLHRLIARDALACLPTEVRPRTVRQNFPAVNVGSSDTRAKIAHAIEREWAVTVDDLVRRRTHLAVQGRDDAGTRAEIATMLRGAGFGGGELSPAVRLGGFEPPTSRSGGARSIP